MRGAGRKAIGIAGALVLCLGLVAAGTISAFSESPADFWLQEAARHAHQSTLSAPAAPARPQASTSSFFGFRPLTVHSLPHREVERPHVEKASAPSHKGSVAICVRLCDGAFFPASSAGGALDGQEACNSLCPGAPTRVYLQQQGSDGIAGAVSQRSGERYEDLPVAYRYMHEHDATCSCHLPRYSPVRMEAFYHDRSLRPGDGVVSKKGIRIFRGSAHFPWRESDFVALADDRHLAGSERRRLDELQQASLHPGAAVSMPPERDRRGHRHASRRHHRRLATR